MADASSTSASALDSDFTTEKILNVADLNASMQHFGWFDYCLFALMLIVSAIIGVYFGFIEKKTKKGNSVDHAGTDSEALNYLVGDRKMKVLPISLSLVASLISGIAMLGTPTEIYVYGTKYTFIIISFLISFAVSWYILLPVFYNLKLTSTYKYFEMRFGTSIRYLCSILFLVNALLYLPLAIYVPALTFNQVSGIDVDRVIPIVSVVCIFYTCVGGLKAVVWTDAVQSFIMFGTVLTVCIKGTIDLGGWNDVMQRNADGGRLNLPDLTLDPRVRLSLFGILVGGTVQFLPISQTILQRYYALPSLKKAKQSLTLYTIFLIFLFLCFFQMGLLTYAAYHDCDPLSTKFARASDQLPTIMIMKVLGEIPGLPGLFVAGVFSATLSTLSTFLNSIACVISEDFIEKLFPKKLSGKQIDFWLRCIVVIFGVCAMSLAFIVEKMGTILQLNEALASVTMGPILGFYIAGLLMPWIKEKCMLMGGVISFVFMSWIIGTAQWAQMNGEIRHEKLPISIEGCTYSFDNSTYLEREKYTPSEKDIYHLSFMWYSVVGSIVCLLFANLSCFIFGFGKTSDVQPELISTVVRKYFYKIELNSDVKDSERKEFELEMKSLRTHSKKETFIF